MNIIEELKEKLGDKIKKIESPNRKRIYITLDKNDIIDGAKFVFNDIGARYIVATGIENFDSFEILYHFSYDKEGIVISLRVYLDKEKPEIESLTKVIPGISYIEREIWELLGINFLGHPNLKHFLLPEDWPEGKYPLRKSSK